MKLNVAEKVPVPTTHEGARAVRLNAEQELRRSVMACMLWEDTFYESGEDIAARIAALVSKTRPAFAAAVAAEARWKMKLRHAPLLVVREMARHPEHKALVGKLLPDVIGRPDEITEFLAIYWRDNPDQPLAAQVKKGLARAFNKFDEFAFAKYDREGKVRLRDALFLSHAKPDDVQGLAQRTKLERRLTKLEPQGTEVVEGKAPRTAKERLFEAIVNHQLKTPDTWEVSLSSGADKRATFERLMAERKLGALAFLRNLRNMQEAGVSKALVAGYASAVRLERVLPFRFVAAARAVPAWEDFVEAMMFRCLKDQPKLPGKTAIVVDNSGSMHGTKVSKRSELDRADAACALAILLREVCEDTLVVGFGSRAQVIANRRGFGLAEAIRSGPGGGTHTDDALALAERSGYDRIVVVTDEQSHQAVRGPRVGTRGYFINVASYKNGIGYGAWTHIDGWSEAVLDYIRAAEGQQEDAGDGAEGASTD